MPLVDECLDQARERDPALQGMMAIGLDIIADAELGAVIESVKVPPLNEVDDAELLTCVRESALGTLLPPPEHDAREEIMLTIRVGSE